MGEMIWIAKRPRDSSLDTSKAVKLLDEKPYELRKALKVLREETERSKGFIGIASNL